VIFIIYVLGNNVKYNLKLSKIHVRFFFAVNIEHMLLFFLGHLVLSWWAKVYHIMYNA